MHTSRSFSSRVRHWRDPPAGAPALPGIRSSRSALPRVRAGAPSLPGIGAAALPGVRPWGVVLLGFSLAQLACAAAPPQSLDDLSTDLRVDSLPARAQVAVNGQWQGFTPATIHLERGQTYQ